MKFYLYDDDEVPDITTGTDTIPVASADTPVDDRMGYIGGSDAPVIAGLSPWKTPYQLYKEKRGEDAPADLSDDERVYWGTVLEDVVAKEYAWRTKRKIRHVYRLINHPNYPFIGAHIDRTIVGEPRILEVKTTGNPDDWDDDIPARVVAQCQHYLAVTGARYCDIAVLILGHRYQQYTVERDEAFIEGLIKIEIDFWNHVVEGIPPTPDTSDEANDLWPDAPALFVHGDESTLFSAQRLYTVKTQMAELKVEKDRLETAIKRQMEDIGDTIVYQGQTIATWKPQKQKRFDIEAFAENNPAYYEQYLKEISSRPFRLKYKP